jgi:transcriptional regulator with XRE-family HTH domain
MQDNAEAIRRQIGHRIKVRRVDRNMVQRELAEAVGADQTQVSAWEGGRRVMRADDLVKVAHDLGTTVAYLVGEGPATESDIPPPRPKIMREKRKRPAVQPLDAA